MIDSHSDPQPLDDDPCPDLPREFIQREERPAKLEKSEKTSIATAALAKRLTEQ